jgi:hypothetical protein
MRTGCFVHCPQDGQWAIGYRNAEISARDPPYSPGQRRGTCLCRLAGILVAAGVVLVALDRHGFAILEDPADFSARLKRRKWLGTRGVALRFAFRRPVYHSVTLTFGCRNSGDFWLRSGCAAPCYLPRPTSFYLRHRREPARIALPCASNVLTPEGPASDIPPPCFGNVLARIAKSHGKYSCL